MKHFRRLSLLLIVFFLFSCEKQEENLSFDQKVERIAKSHIAAGKTPGMAFGVVRNGEKKFYSYGVADLATGLPIDESTIFEIGSITKTFTGILFAQLALEGTISLQDTVNNYMPANMQLPSMGNTPVRLLHLLNHTSGFPREPDDIGTEEPFAYTEAQMSDYLGRLVLNSVPGTQHLYSNTAMGLAGYTAKFATGSTYTDLVKSRIFEKLDMQSSFCANSETPGYNVAQGYYGNKPVEFFAWSDVFSSAGIIKSNMHDMLIFLENCLYPSESVLKEAIELSMSPTFTIEEDVYAGLGWGMGINEKGNLVFYHDGGTRGFASFIGLNMENHTGFVLLINSYCLGEQDFIGAEMLDIISGN